MRTTFRLIAAVAMAFLYIPIITLIVMSFNGGSNPYQMDGLSLRWYAELFGDKELFVGLKNTLIVAFSSTAIAVVVGTLLALGLARAVNSRFLDVAAVSPAIIPDVVQGIGLLSLFALLAVPLGLLTVISGHAVFTTAFVVAAVSAKLATLDGSLEEASRDLGASGPTTFIRVTLPTIAPGIVAGGLLAFTLSIDEYVMAFFTNGPASPTLPIIVYSRVRFALTPEINALGALLVLASAATLLLCLRFIDVRERSRQ